MNVYSVLQSEQMFNEMLLYSRSIILFALHFIDIAIFNIQNKYYRNFSGDSLGQVEAVDVCDVAK